MRRLPTVPVAIAAVVASALALGAQETLESKLAGQARSGENAEFIVTADLEGDFAGYFTLTINHSGSTVQDGSWVLTRKRIAPDGTEEELGLLEGTVSGGELTLTEGRIASVKTLGLRIDSGTGDFANVSGGTGSLEGTIQSVAFAGTLKLTF